MYLRIDRNFCSVHEEITSIRLYTLCNPRSGLRKGVYNKLWRQYYVQVMTVSRFKYTVVLLS
jgi:hypothetical protein